MEKSKFKKKNEKMNIGKMTQNGSKRQKGSNIFVSAY